VQGVALKIASWVGCSQRTVARLMLTGLGFPFALPLIDHVLESLHDLVSFLRFSLDRNGTVKQPRHLTVRTYYLG